MNQSFQLSENRLILSIWWGYCSGAALILVNFNTCTCQVIGAASEERFSRIKNTSAFPAQTIAWLSSFLPEYSKSTFDSVVYTGNDVGIEYILMDKAKWSVSDYYYENENYWKPFLLDGATPSYFDVMSRYLDFDTYPGKKYWESIGVGDPQCDLFRCNTSFNTDIASQISQFTSVPIENVYRVNHHQSHASYAYATISEMHHNFLIFTCDGWGDGENATVWQVSRSNGKITSLKKIFSSRTCLIARVYRYITLLLGMKPSEHEFKVMGLAPYSKTSFHITAKDIFSDACWYEDGLFKVNPFMRDTFYHFKDKLATERFDNIAAGLQSWTEELLIRWTSDIVQKSGISDIAFSGGVALNVKAIQVLSEQDFINTVHAPPSSSDESHILGAPASWIMSNLTEIRFDDSFRSIPYYGPVSCNESIFNIIPSNLYDLESLATLHDVDQETSAFIARLLSNGKILATCRGASEFGARALGNRSLLMTPGSSLLKERLNGAIKNRDFWMPFAPIILDSHADIYLKRKPGTLLSNRFMTQTFPLTDIGYERIFSAAHPGDKTSRAQILMRQDNPFLYDLIHTFGSLTGTYALLNTSFNVHGMPIVNSLRDAYSIFSSTSIDILLSDSHYFLKQH